MRTKEIKGITLVTLAITIVILLILAGVSVSLVIGNNNLFDKAKSTQKIQTIAGIKEALELEKADIQVESKTVNLENYLEQISTGKKNYELSSKEKLDDKNAEIIVNDQYKFLVKDKENGDVEIIYEGVAVLRGLTLSSYEETYTYPNNGTFTVTNNTSGGKLSVESDAPNIATASIEENTVTVVPGTTAGKANIIVKSAANGDYAENKVIHVATVENGTIKLSVTPYTGIYDGQEHNAFTSISTNPGDAKLEYSLDGNEYNEEMPTITNSSSFTVTVRASKAGYKTQSTTETVKVNKAEGKLMLSATSGTSEYSKDLTFTVSGNTGTLSVVSSNTNIATASISGNTVTVKSGTTSGTATITVKSAANTNYNEKTATYTATVKNLAFTEEPGVGLYADTDGDGKPDGIIFEDFKIGGSGTWGTGDYGKYTIQTVSNIKDYYISQTDYEGPFGVKSVLMSKGSGNARFYAMALQDYNDKTYGFRSAQKITISGNWVIPSINELSAFGGELGITSSNYTKYGLRYRYCS
ncbi:MAG: type II secretion system protein [Clostridia bacterium]